ncbi:hypothetical protein ACFOGI_16715 [Virgibacillus xinjiangensis]|uniref:Uncharacterized protein n=1 Tax=Virgibacillus xinjiangensis TaxID=393090 RepID=A0ABV7D0B9_9BACI
MQFISRSREISSGEKINRQHPQEIGRSIGLSAVARRNRQQMQFISRSREISSGEK